MKQIFLNDRLVLAAIFSNLLILFLLSFNSLNRPELEYTDYFFTIFFALEAIIKIKEWGWKDYIHSNWNKLDFILVILTTPLILALFTDLSNWNFLFILRTFRVARFFRFMRFVPNLELILNGVGRALHASVFVLIIFFLYNFIVALFSCYLFREYSPEHFGNALLSFYATFKLFTMEGWNEIPEVISQGKSAWEEIGIKLYFITVVLTGGIFGISMVNAIFVEEMVSDNNDELENKVTRLEEKIERLTELLNKKS